LPKAPSLKFIGIYAKYISFSGKNFGLPNYQWITLLRSLNRIVDLYNQNLKEILDPHLDKFRCPVFYRNREILIKQNAFIDMNSITFVILDWVFYFFSPEFKEHSVTESDRNIKLLSRLTALIFILFNNAETARVILDQKEIYDKWIENLEESFKTSNYCASPNDIFAAFYDEIKNFDGSNEFSFQNNLQLQIQVPRRS
jgi:hypothetical protein